MDLKFLFLAGSTDIVRPNIPPPEMAKHVVKQDKASAAEVSVGADGVIDVTAIED